MAYGAKDRERRFQLLSAALTRARDVREVADLVATAVTELLESDSAALWSWTARTGVMSALSTAGLPPELSAALRLVEVRPDETPELRELLARREPLVLLRDEVAPSLAVLLDGLGLSGALGIALRAGDDVLGALTASWSTSPAGELELEDSITVLQAIADQASVALAWLLAEARSRHDRSHDPLTGLLHRKQLLDEVVASCRAGRTGLLVVDLPEVDRLELRSPAVADEVLRQVSARLVAAVPAAAGVGRLAAGRFAVVLRSVGEAELTAAVSACRSALEPPLRVDGLHLRVVALVGGAQSTADGSAEPQELLATARRAAGMARAGAPVTRIDLTQGTLTTGPTAGELREALRRGQLRLALQPLVSLGEAEGSPGVVVGAEALVRWEHPRLGLLLPGSFLGLAEREGLIADVDLWVLDQACAAASTWPSGRRQHIAVNVAATTLHDPRLAESVRRAVVEGDRAQLHLEVLESRALLDLPAITGDLTALRHLGVRISLDDFGTGFSTLSWLQQLPVDVLKIDRSFVVASVASADIRPERRSEALLRGVVALGRECGLQVIAEGVETPDQLDAVRRAGCTLVQGYLFGRPGSPEDLLELLQVEVGSEVD